MNLNKKSTLVCFWSNYILFTAILFFIICVYRFSEAVNRVAYDSPDTRLSPTLKERQIAQEQAIREGKKEYTFTTSFIPGIGYLSDPKAFQQQQITELKELIKQTPTTQTTK